MFTILHTPELFISQAKAETFAKHVRAQGYTSNVWHRNYRDQQGYAVAVYGEDGFKGYANLV